MLIYKKILRKHVGENERNSKGKGDKPSYQNYTT